MDMSFVTLYELALLSWGGCSPARVVSTAIIGEDESGLVIHRFGRRCRQGASSPSTGEAGFQARLLSPGWHFGMWRWRFKMRRVPLMVVRPGEIALVVAADGAAIPSERVLGRTSRATAFRTPRRF